MRFSCDKGLQMARAGAREGRFLGNMIATAGFLLAAVPLALISVVFWVLARA